MTSQDFRLSCDVYTMHKAGSGLGIRPLLVDISVLVLKTTCRRPRGPQPFALVGVPEQALGGFPWVWIDFGR